MRPSDGRDPSSPEALLQLEHGGLLCSAVNGVLRLLTAEKADERKTDVAPSKKC
jgi:hypothetical protein